MKQTIGIVGLGIMGRGMAVNFLKHGYTVYGWNRTSSVAQDMSAQGLIPCTTPAEVVQKADIIFEITANDDSSRSVWLGREGMLSAATAEKYLVASGTFSVTWIDELIRSCREKSLRFFDIPLTGGRVGAETGNLTMLCGGDAQGIETLRPVFAAISKKIFHFGSVGSGMRYKLILNFMQALHIVGYAQAMKIAKAHNLDLAKVSQALVDRPGGVVTEIAQKRYFNDTEPITFQIDWIVKDLTYARQYAEGLDITLLQDTLAEFLKAQKEGFGDHDWASISHILAEKLESGK